jgi:hypothetical protein
MQAHEWECSRRNPEQTLLEVVLIEALTLEDMDSIRQELTK